MSNTKYLVGAVALAALLAACEGDGSDVGLQFDRLPEAYGRVLVLDDQGRGVTGAVVEAPALGLRGVTGSTGRATLYTALAGPVRIRVDGATGAAVAGDALGAVEFLAPAATDLTVAVYLPEHPASATAPIVAGTQAGPVAVTSVGGATLTVAAASSVGLPDGAAAAELALGELAAHHLPAPLPTATGGAWLFSRGYSVVPAGATFTNATLDAPDELRGTATLFRLDPDSGEWSDVGSNLAPAAGRLVATALVERGGIYAFATLVPTATVRGRIVDEEARGLGEQLVGVDGRWVVSGSDGRFVVTSVPGALGDGGARSAAVEVLAGGRYRPARVTAAPAVTANGDVDVGDLVLPTVAVVDMRVQQVRRGRAEPFRRTSIGSARYPFAVSTTVDAGGAAAFDDVPILWSGFQHANVRDRYEANFAQGIVYADGRTRLLDTYVYYDEVGWFLGGRRSRTVACDSVGGGPVEGAVIVSGSVAGQGYQGITREAGALFLDRNFGGRATASLRTSHAGRTVTSAISIVQPNGEHLELPLERALWQPLAAFDRHGLVAGRLLGANPARDHELRSLRPLELEEWWDDVVGGLPIRVGVPLDVDPATTHDEFVVGMASRGGNLAAVELDIAGGARTLLRGGIALDVLPTEGATVARDVPLDRLADQAFVAAGALTGLDAALTASQLRVDLALQRSNGTVVDVVRELAGNHAANGADLTFSLPALGGQLAGANWLALVRGSASNAGVTIEQKLLCRLGGTTVAPAMLAPPTITEPAAGGTVAASGFTVRFALPPGCLFARLDLVHDVGSERNSWRICLPPDATEFAFVTLPQQAVTPLVIGRTYTLTLTAYRADDSELLLSQYPYWSYSTFLQSLSPVEAGVVAVASRSIQVTAQ